MKPNLNSILLFAVIILLGWLILRGEDRTVDNVSTTEIDSLKVETGKRDTVLMMYHDTVIYRTNQVKSTIVEYRIETDTILKLQLCDSLADQAEKLAVECRELDSLHIIQETDLKSIIGKQDTVIQTLTVDNKKLRRNNRILGGIAILATIAAILK